jgi:hypothetical protein
MITKRGRPPGTKGQKKQTGEPVLVRFLPHELAALDAWITEHAAFHLPRSRQDAVRWLVAFALQQIEEIERGLTGDIKR